MILKGNKVILRPIRIADAPRFVQWLENPKVRRFLSQTSYTLPQEQKWIRGLTKNKNEKIFALDAVDGTHIGSIGLHINPRQQHRVAGFGIFIGDRRYWNQGHGTDAMRIILIYAFSSLKLHRVELSVFPFNKRAIHVYKKFGFRLEGRKRERLFVNGKFHDELEMGLLDREWRARQRKTIK